MRHSFSSRGNLRKSSGAGLLADSGSTTDLDSALCSVSSESSGVSSLDNLIGIERMFLHFLDIVRMNFHLSDRLCLFGDRIFISA